MTEQHIPIFVGSTYLDLKEHREKIRDTLTRMETFVHGMEQFGARDESPLETCLKEVGKCKIYVGIFAMRYGSIPSGYEKSMTELEYDEAQRLGLPSYIFILDEQNGFVNPSSIDFENQDKLQAFKRKLMNKTVESFTTPDDLANKVGTAIHRALKDEKAGPVEIDEGIEEVLPSKNEHSAKSILKRFEFFPERWAGVEFKGSFYNYISQHKLIIPDRYASANNVFRSNETIRARWPLTDIEKATFYLYAEKEEAYTMIETDFPAFFEVVAETFIEDVGDKEGVNPIYGIKIKKIMDVLPVKFDNDIPF